MRKLTLIVLISALVLCNMCWGAAATFSDVNVGDWYYGHVTNMSAVGEIKGYPDGQFKPNKQITCGEFVSIVARCKGLKEVPSPKSSHWAAGLSEAALNSGLYDWDEIPPDGQAYDKEISRQVAVKIIMNAFAPDVTGEYSKWMPQIKDFSSLDSRYYEKVFGAYERGIVVGDDRGNFNAKQGLTRAEACALLQRGRGNFTKESSEKKTEVAKYGWLTVKGTQLSDEKGEPVILRGMSSHGIQWYPQYTSEGSIKATRDYGANVFRIAMYTQEGGYLADSSVKNKVIQAADAAIKLDMYVIIDWHILSDGNPNTYLVQSKDFFAEMAERYKDQPRVMFEICNEPNGDVTWENDIRPYAMEVIPVIRRESPRSVVLVGTGTWSQDVDQVANAPLPYENVMYTCHFYAGSHGADLQGKIQKALDAEIPIFVSEWGTSQATGNGGPYIAESIQWLNFLEARGISWVNWSLCDKGESSAALKAGASGNGGWNASQLSQSGEFVFSRFS